MTTQTLILPYARTSPLYMPRRDLVLAASDSLTLRVTVAESDNPDALALDLAGVGIGGPMVTLLIYAPQRRAWDYGWPYCSPTVLWSGSGAISSVAVGSFDLTIPAGSFANFPRRCAWAVRLDWQHGDASELLAHGMVHFRPAIAAPLGDTLILTDTSIPVMTDVSVPLEA